MWLQVAILDSPAVSLAAVYGSLRVSVAGWALVVHAAAVGSIG
jgi:hypothetical protein